MNTFLVLQELQKLLKERLSTYPFQAHEQGRKDKDCDGEDDLRVPKVLIGSMPSREQDRKETIPFVLIQAMQGRDIDGLHCVDIAFRLAVRNRDTEALEHDLHNFIAVVRNTLLEINKAPLSNKIQLLESENSFLPWTRPDEQEEPYAQAFILGKFSFQSMQ